MKRQGWVRVSHVNRPQYFHYMEMKESRPAQERKSEIAAFQNFPLSLAVGGKYALTLADIRHCVDR